MLRGSCRVDVDVVIGESHGRLPRREQAGALRFGRWDERYGSVRIGREILLRHMLHLGSGNEIDMCQVIGVVSVTVDTVIKSRRIRMPAIGFDIE